MERFATTKYIETLDSQSFKAFLHALSQEKVTSEKSYISVTLPIAGIDPLAALELHPDMDEKFYWDHPKNSISISAAGKVAELKATGANRFSEIAELKDSIKKNISAYTSITHSMAGPLFLGGYSFNDHNVGTVWNKFGAARFVLPKWILIQNNDLHLLTIILENDNRDISDIYQEIIERITDFLQIAGRLNKACHPQSNRPTILCSHELTDEKSRWIKKVESAKNLIDREKFKKIVLARKIVVESKKKIEPTLLAHYLRQRYPECYNFMIQIGPETSFVGATPERLASFENGIFNTEGLAGSASRGKSATEDAALAQSLLQSQKDRSEHQFVVRAIDDSLGPYSYRIEHSKKPQIKKLKNVQHLFTPISASIKEGVQIHELLNKLHPTPAVGGFPQQSSVKYIQELEQIERGWYSAPVGWFNLNGCGEFAVAIRSALLNENYATMYAGCGIVEDSDPETEWNETLLKFRPMLDALNQFEQAYD